MGWFSRGSHSGKSGGGKTKGIGRHAKPTRGKHGKPAKGKGRNADKRDGYKNGGDNGEILDRWG